MSVPSTTMIDLLRHGEVTGGARYRGWTDDPLSADGWAQMHAVTDGHCPWQVVVSSPLARCRAFAAELAGRHGLPLELDDRWKELYFGAWEGCNAQQLLAADAQCLSRFWSDPVANGPPGGESLVGFAARVRVAWEEMLQRHAGRHVLLVAHGGSIRMVLREVLAIPFERVLRIDVPHAGLTRVRVDGVDAEVLPQLVFHAGRL